MYISLNWIKDFVDIGNVDIKEFTLKFTLSAAEVEGYEIKGQDIKDVVVGKVVALSPHPGSEKLKLADVDTGNGIIRSVCGAPNVKVGMLAPFALPEGSIKGVPKIKKAKVRGEESSGILCSERELGISDDHSGLMELPESFAVGKDIREYIPIDDIIIEIDNKSLTNRPDLWGHYGIAREVAAICGRPLLDLPIKEITEDETMPKIPVTILDTEKCYRYTCLGIGNITRKASPYKIAVRLYYCGMRKVSFLVDLTNYCMLETGQPLHAFDTSQVNEIVVRSFDKPVKFTTLDDVERDVPADTLFICDRGKCVALAGVMGGQNSEVVESTGSIILESASFNGAAVRKGAARLGLRTESSARFEKMLDPEMALITVKRFLYLTTLYDTDAKQVTRITDENKNPYKKITISITKDYIDGYIGESLSMEKIISILRSLEFEVDRKGDELVVGVPSFRATKDITMKCDLVEEISRIYGYDNIQPAPVKLDVKTPVKDGRRIVINQLKDILTLRFSMSEVNSYLWYDSDENKELGLNVKGEISLQNPNSPQNAQIRMEMAPSLLYFAKENFKYMDDFSIYEVGSCFKKDEKGAGEENKRLCILTGSRTQNEDNLFYSLKSVCSYLVKFIKDKEAKYVEYKADEYSFVHPVKSVQIFCEDVCIGYISVIHPNVSIKVAKKASMAVLEIDTGILAALGKTYMKFAEPLKFPEVKLDFNFLADADISFDEIYSHIKKFKNIYLLRFGFTDIYTGKGLPEGKKSLLFYFDIGSREKTLTGENIQDFSENLINHMKEKGYTLR